MFWREATSENSHLDENRTHTRVHGNRNCVLSVLRVGQFRLPAASQADYRVEMTVTIVADVILLDCSEFLLLACPAKNGEMRRLFLSGKLSASWRGQQRILSGTEASRRRERSPCGLFAEL